VHDSAFRANLVELLEGGQAYPSVESALANVKPELRHVSSGPGLHSVYYELEHMRRAQEDILRYTLDPAWTSPKWPDGYWPSHTGPVTDEEWEKSLAGFKSDREELIGLVKDSSVDLTAEIPHGEGRTYLREILLAADHNAYHLGQIVQTRKALGNWPG
jgi:hypothetical protein